MSKYYSKNGEQYEANFKIFLKEGRKYSKKISKTFKILRIIEFRRINTLTNFVNVLNIR